KIDALANRAFLAPMLDGEYPADLLADTAHVSDWSFVREGDLETVRQPLSILGVNYYSTVRVRHFSGDGERSENDGHGASKHSPWIGVDDVEFVQQPGPYTAMGWNIEPAGMTELLVSVAKTYPHQPMMVTENGAAFADEVTVDADGTARVHDDRRVAYLHDHVDAVGAAIDAGADVRGYFAWSLLDNFEWGYGYERRFGIIRVDYDTLERTWKDSAHWYRRLATSNVLPGVDETA
ncbi:MAG: beta-glucosidase, partial [Cellulosimicrobium sp.]|nr:beta-glucosidase [Cellulosimicrobium sp.]